MLYTHIVHLLFYGWGQVFAIQLVVASADQFAIVDLRCLRLHLPRSLHSLLRNRPPESRRFENALRARILSRCFPVHACRYPFRCLRSRVVVIVALNITRVTKPQLFFPLYVTGMV